MLRLTAARAPRALSLLRRTPLPALRRPVAPPLARGFISQPLIRAAAPVADDAEPAWRTERFYGPPSTPMWAHQDKVRRLPVPTLADTVTRFVEMVQPLCASEEEFQRAAAAARQLTGPQGQQLQAELERLNAQSPTSWLEGLWDSMYLLIRDPLVVNVAPFLLLTDDPRRPLQEQRAAFVLHSCAHFAAQIRQNQLPPDFERDQPMDMSQYRKLFGSVRLPRNGRDVCVTYTKSRHVIVLHRNKFYPVDVLQEDGLTPVSEADLQRQLRAIIDSYESGPAVGLFTADNRDQWAVNRAVLEKDPVTRAVLERIDSAMFVLCLDSHAPSTLEEASRQLLCGDGNNRWWDKLQIVVFQNGRTASLLEHTPIDGHTMLRLCEDMDKHSKALEPPPPTELQQTTVRKTPLALELPVMRKMHVQLEESRHRFHKFVNSVETVPLQYADYGKDFAVKCKVSPDAWVQIAFQIAYYRLRGHPDSTYESANTKRFVAGRTETLRSVTMENLRLARAWRQSDVTKEEKIALLRAAAQKHVERMKLAKEGQGVDRHLFVLEQIANWRQTVLPRTPRPQLFDDPLYSKLRTSILSTSNVSSSVFTLFGFGPVVPNGLGLAYNIHDGEMLFNVSSFQGEATAYAQLLKETLDEMAQLFGR